jgi:hypothetical protein
LHQFLNQENTTNTAKNQRSARRHPVFMREIFLAQPGGQPQQIGTAQSKLAQIINRVSYVFLSTRHSV